MQVEAPPSVASGLQRVGRAGHSVGEVSRGVILPKHRGDLLAAAVVAERMRAGQIEALHVPRNPLDVLAQQIVAMLAVDEWTVDDLAVLVRRAAPFQDLPASALEATLDMLAGRYPSDDFAELRPRITWDRASNLLRARPGANAWPSPVEARFPTGDCSVCSWSVPSRPPGWANSTRKWSTSPAPAM